MSKEGANWNAKYVMNHSGRAFKIKDLSLKQTNSFKKEKPEERFLRTFNSKKRK